MQPSINPSPFVRFALSVLVARSGTRLSRVLLVAYATSGGVVLAFVSGWVVFCYRPRASVGLPSFISCRVQVVT